MTAAWEHPDKPGTRDLSRLWWRVRDVGKRLGRFIDVPLNRILIIAGIISLIVTGAGGGLKLGLSFGSRERSVIVPWLCGRSRIRLWDWQNGRALGEPLTGHEYPIHKVMFRRRASPDFPQP